jgi:hypothetical protein
LGEEQGVDPPSYNAENSIDDTKTSLDPRRYDHVKFRPRINDDTDYPQQEGDSYLPPTDNNPARTTTESNLPPVHFKKRAPMKPPSSKKPNIDDDSYL